MKQYRMISKLTYLCSLILLFAGTVQAADVEENFKQANEAYSAGQYQEALDAYRALLDVGYSSVSLYYNLGNTHYKLGHIAPAILNYERALKLDPSYADAAFNLKLANLRVVDNLETVPRLFVVEWFQNWFASRSSSQWASLSLILLWLAVGLGVMFLFLPNPIVKRIGFFGGVLLFGMAMLSTGISLQRRSSENKVDQGPAIIYTPNAYVKDAPEGKTDLLILHEGIKVQMEERVGDWIKISLDDANIGEIEGFVKADAIVKI